jgi:hypothetical protein
MQVKNDEYVWELIARGRLRLWPDPSDLLRAVSATESEEARQAVHDRVRAIYDLQSKLRLMREGGRPRFSLFELGFLAGKWSIRHVGSRDVPIRSSSPDERPPTANPKRVGNGTTRLST